MLFDGHYPFSIASQDDLLTFSDALSGTLQAAQALVL
jgi:hypothetical protein